jgi:SAM-dependent methyltransferase
MKVLVSKIVSEWTQIWKKTQITIRKPLDQLDKNQLQTLEHDLWIPLEPLCVQDYRGLFYDFIKDVESEQSFRSSTHYFESSPTLLVKSILEKVSLKPGQVFVDLGGGIGQVGLIAALMQPKLKANIAIDIFAEGLEHGAAFLKRTYFPYPIKFIEDDFYKNKNIFRKGDVFYHYVALSRKGLIKLVERWIENSKSGSKFILIDDFEREKDLKTIPQVRLSVFENNQYFSRRNHKAFVLTKK